MDETEKRPDEKVHTEAGFDVAKILRQNQESNRTEPSSSSDSVNQKADTAADRKVSQNSSADSETVRTQETEENESAGLVILDFLSTFFVALIVMIAGILVIGQLAGFHLFNVASGSMTPTYPVNSLVIVRDVDPASIEAGDVITFVMNEDGMLVTHRVVSVDSSDKTFRTKGDANNVEDAAPVLWGNVVGKVIFGIPAVGGPFAVMTAKENRKIMIGIILGLFLLSIWWDGNKKKRSREGAGDETK